ncbi:ATP-binding protein [Streptomyces subrutilus]|uniref:ATP-binding protein n=1 Tax=Streptomyces subrutilus TaxID=36818 RepID=UPI0033E566C7
MNSQIRISGTRFAAQLPATPRGARLARRLVVGQLDAWGVAAEGAAVVVAELAANAVTHGRVPGRDFRVALALTGGVLRIEVADARADRVPGARDAAGDDEGGRGLLLVAAVADRWGVDRGLPPGKTVWAEVRVDGGPGAGRVVGGRGAVGGDVPGVQGTGKTHPPHPTHPTGPA